MKSVKIGRYILIIVFLFLVGCDKSEEKGKEDYLKRIDRLEKQMFQHHHLHLFFSYIEKKDNAWIFNNNENVVFYRKKYWEKVCYDCDKLIKIYTDEKEMLEDRLKELEGANDYRL